MWPLVDCLVLEAMELVGSVVDFLVLGSLVVWSLVVDSLVLEAMELVGSVVDFVVLGSLVVRSLVVYILVRSVVDFVVLGSLVVRSLVVCLLELWLGEKNNWCDQPERSVLADITRISPYFRRTMCYPSMVCSTMWKVIRRRCMFLHCRSLEWICTVLLAMD